MPTSHVVLLLLGLTVAICLLAFWKGGVAERIGAGVILANLILTVVGDALFSSQLQPIIQQSSDGVTALILLVITVTYGSLWLGGAMLLYAAQFALHSYYLVTNRPIDYFHVAVNNLDFLGISLCLAMGTAATWRRRQGARGARTSSPA